MYWAANVQGSDTPCVQSCHVELWCLKHSPVNVSEPKLDMVFLKASQFCFVFFFSGSRNSKHGSKHLSLTPAVLQWNKKRKKTCNHFLSWTIDQLLFGTRGDSSKKETLLEPAHFSMSSKASSKSARSWANSWWTFWKNSARFFFNKNDPNPLDRRSIYITACVASSVGLRSGCSFLACRK